MVRRPSRRLKPHPYLDTNVILDYIRNRNPDSSFLLETIKRRKIQCCTSYFTVLELLDTEQENKWIWRRVQHGETFDDILRHRYPRRLEKDELDTVFTQLRDKFLKPFIDTNIVRLILPDAETWDYVPTLMHDSNLEVKDAFHVDAALIGGCNIFISRDSELVKMINDGRVIPASQPVELDKKLAELGIRRIIP